MATVAHRGTAIPVEMAHPYWPDRIIVALPFIWTVIGPVAFILYEYRVNNYSAHDGSALSALRLGDLQASYFSGALLNFAIGLVVWVAGVVFLGSLAWRHYSHHADH